jgi:glycosyltransferase involved in cell wall biosynthesis
MKIAIDCRMLGMSGIGVYFDHILTYLISNNTNNTFLLIGYKSKLEGYEEFPQCQILYTTIPVISFRELFYFPTREINKCDVFYSPNSNIPFGIKIPIFSTIFDLVFLDVKGLTSRIGKFMVWLMIWRAIRISKTIFTISNFSKERIQFHYKTGKEIVITYCGVRKSLQNFEISPDSPYEFPYVLYVGNIKKHKGIRLLLKAYNQSRINGFVPKLLIVGGFENFKTRDDEVIAMIKKQDENVIFTGKISDSQLFNVIAHSSLLVQPSIYEGFGLPPLEALFLGCNVLISDIPVFREIYEALPVTFFNTNSIVELSEKMTNCISYSCPNHEIRNDINKLYNMDESAKIILKHLEKPL